MAAIPSGAFGQNVPHRVMEECVGVTEHAPNLNPSTEEKTVHILDQARSPKHAILWNAVRS